MLSSLINVNSNNREIYCTCTLPFEITLYHYEIEVLLHHAFIDCCFSELQLKLKVHVHVLLVCKFQFILNYHYV